MGLPDAETKEEKAKRRYPNDLVAKLLSGFERNPIKGCGFSSK